MIWFGFLIYQSYLAQPAEGHGARIGGTSHYPKGLSLDYEERARSEDVLRQFCEICMNAIKIKFDVRSCDYVALNYYCHAVVLFIKL